MKISYKNIVKVNKVTHAYSKRQKKVHTRETRASKLLTNGTCVTYE
jgi:hypothetical protein